MARLWGARERLHVAALSRLGWLDRFNLQGRARLGNATFRVPIVHGVGAQNLGVSEPWLDRVLARLPLKSGIFVDVGANVGQTLLKVMAVDRGIEYWGFEPNPRCFCYLQDLVSINAFERVRLYPLALGEAPAVVDLLYGDRTDQAASIVQGFRAEAEYCARQFVTVFKGDELLQSRTQSVATVKVDVEGAELEVMRGVRKMLVADRPTVICEILPIYDATTERGRFRLQRQRELEALFASASYRTHRVRADGSLEALLQIEVHGDLQRTNYVFLPSEAQSPVAPG